MRLLIFGDCHWSSQCKINSTKNKGRIWVTNKVDSKVIHKEELESYIQLGFKKGRKKS